MSTSEQIREVQRWLRYAHEDLVAAESMLEQEVFVSRQACWLAQQAAEKALKAALVFLETDFPRSHDLEALCALLPAGWTVKGRSPDLGTLTQ